MCWMCINLPSTTLNSLSSFRTRSGHQKLLTMACLAQNRRYVSWEIMTTARLIQTLTPDGIQLVGLLDKSYVRYFELGVVTHQIQSVSRWKWSGYSASKNFTRQQSVLTYYQLLNKLIMEYNWNTTAIPWKTQGQMYGHTYNGDG